MHKKIIEKAISQITERKEPLFNQAVEENKEQLKKRFANKTVLVIGGAGSIGTQFILELIYFNPKRIVVIDLNENGLTELTRQLHNMADITLPELKTYPLSYAGTIFSKIVSNEGPFDIVAHFAALKHVRSEKDSYSIEAMFNNNFLNVARLLKLLKQKPPQIFFSVSSDKATNPVSIMGATKNLMEKVLFSYNTAFPVVSARFANVAFSNGSLLESYIHRYESDQPIVCPQDIKRYFVSPKEAGQLCLLACGVGTGGEIFIPKLSQNKNLIPFTKTVTAFFSALQKEFKACKDEQTLIQHHKSYLNNKDKPYPVMFFKSDTSGEKSYEEFYSTEDKVDWERVAQIGILQHTGHGKLDVVQLLSEAETLFNTAVQKEDIVQFLKKWVPTFKHNETGKNLDDKR